MSEIIVGTVLVVGIAVCLLGGVGITAILATWALDKTLIATGNMSVVVQWWMSKKYPERFKG